MPFFCDRKEYVLSILKYLVLLVLLALAVLGKIVFGIPWHRLTASRLPPPVEKKWACCSFVAVPTS